VQSPCESQPSALLPHDAHCWPGAAQAAALRTVQTLPLQQPVGQLLASQMHSPPSHSLPAGQLAPAPQVHVPASQPSPTPAQLAQAWPAGPHALTDSAMQAPASLQQPAQLLGSQTQLPP